VQNNGLAKRNTLLLIAAFAAIYILWGSTYLAIKFAIVTLPTFVMTGSRFLVAGVTLFLIGRFSKGYVTPTRSELRAGAVVGILLFLGGTGAVALSEHYITSSLAALLVATEPFWVVLLSWLWLKGPRPNWKVVLGLVLGFAGVALLIGGSGLGDGVDAAKQIPIAALVIAGSLSWAAGSVYGMKAPSPKSPFVTAGVQMLSGGSALVLLGTFLGEWKGFEITAVSRASWLGLLYLLVFGSLIAFTAYSWLLKNASPAIVATYAYVNPVVAVFLGWAFGGESFSSKMLLGAAVIIGSVALITTQGTEKKVKQEARTLEPSGEGSPSYST
jgi:drug/metabolite transporter (DMT)-like permease